VATGVPHIEELAHQDIKDAEEEHLALVGDSKVMALNLAACCNALRALQNTDALVLAPRILI